MYVVAITGGIAMGKSTFVGMLQEADDAWPLFDADAAVRQLLTKPEIGRKIADEFGEPALDGDGQVSRPFLREQVFDSAERRAALEGILHPEVRTKFEDTRSAASRGGAKGLIADIPLFYESRSPYPADAVVVVATDAQNQMARLVSRPGIDREVAAKMIDAQLPIGQKMADADLVVWNSGSRGLLQIQSNFLIRWLRKKTN